MTSFEILLITLTIGFVIVWAVLNRVSGGGYGEPPGRPIFWTAPAAGILTGLYAADWKAGAVVAVGYLLWRLQAWGRWFDLERLPDGYAREGKRPSLFEKMIESMSAGSDHVAFGLRNFFGFLPVLILFALASASWGMGYDAVWATSNWKWVALAPVLALLVVGIYEFCWRAVPDHPIPNAEYLTGGLWGILVAGWTLI